MRDRSEFSGTTNVCNNSEIDQLSESNIVEASDYIRQYIDDFNYDDLLSKFKNKDILKEWYSKAKSAEEKLEIIRIYAIDNDNVDNVFFDFVTETYHVENNELFSLPEERYESVPRYIIAACDDIMINN